MQEVPRGRVPKSVEWLALVAGVLPVLALAVLSGIETLSSQEFLMPGPMETLGFALFLSLGFGGFVIFLHVVSCKDSLRFFSSGEGNVMQDIISGFVLALGIFAVMMLLNFLAGLTGLVGDSWSIVEMAEGLANDPVLLAVYLGPVVWLQAGFFEELWRTFMLRRLWNIYPDHQHIMLIVSSIIFGLGHLYQGWYGVIGTAVIGYVLGLAFMRRRRFLQIVVAHAVYDTVALIILVNGYLSGAFEI